MVPGSQPKRADAEMPTGFGACPFLGLEQDFTTWLAYPNPANYCHRARPAANLNLHYQESICLTSKHVTCPGFTHGWEGPLPEMARGEPASKRNDSRLLLPVLVGLVLLLVLAGWQAMRRGWLPFMGAAGETPTSLDFTPSQVGGLVVQSPTPTLSPSPLPTATSNRSMTQTALAGLISPTPTASPTLANTPTPAPPTPGPAFKTPFGPGEKYLLHQLKAGESMGTLVTLYDTSNQVVAASNQLVEGASIWPGSVLLIIPGEKDPTAATRFRVVLLEAPISAEDLAAEYGISVEDLRLFNSLGATGLIPAGRYLIIPVES